ncbi:MAG: DUF460 domain-containing protein [Candidatus Aenigmarchaeota archaeon]|nr:DUF460 domain-containing protein [Candidatus Aenigmarchaeota archaeon]
MEKLLIVGIDPGTTTAIACLDIHGSLVLSRSGRNMTRGEVVKMVNRTGKPFIVASDIFPPPKKVEKIAASFSAMLIHPEENPKRKKKVEKIKEMDIRKHPNKHEKDAMAAALYAYKRIRPEINKIEQELKRRRMKADLEHIVFRVLARRERISSVLEAISSAEL